jgi:hypothetical protein
MKADGGEFIFIASVLACVLILLALKVLGP